MVGSVPGPVQLLWSALRIGVSGRTPLALFFMRALLLKKPCQLWLFLGKFPLDHGALQLVEMAMRKAQERIGRELRKQAK